LAFLFKIRWNFRRVWKMD